METERLILCRFEEKDLDDVYEYLSDPETVRFEPYPPVTRKEAADGLAWRISTHEMIAMETKDTGKVIGNIYLGDRDCDNRELGYVLNRAYWHNGFAQEACRAVLAEAFEQGTHRIYAECDPQNPASWHLLERLGFRREAFLRGNVYFHKDESGNPVWKDTYVYSLLRSEETPFSIVPIDDALRPRVDDFLRTHWLTTEMAERGELIDMRRAEGFAAVADGTIVGLITTRPFGDAVEILSLDSVREGIGIGSGLMDAVRQRASDSGAKRVTLITTNDNTRALRFYQRRGFSMTGLYCDAVTRSRALKPEIPLYGEDGIPLRHEIELELPL